MANEASVVRRCVEDVAPYKERGEMFDCLVVAIHESPAVSGVFFVGDS